MNLRSGRIIQPPEESGSNDPRSIPSLGTGPSVESRSNAITSLRRIFSESSFSSDAMSAYEEGNEPRAEAPSNSASLLDRFSNFIGLGNTNTNAPIDPPAEEEVSSYFANEALKGPPHIEVGIPTHADNEEIELALNGMTHEELQQIEGALQLARQLEAEATLRGQQRLIERQAKATKVADKGKAKMENDLSIDSRIFHTVNWEYTVKTQTLHDKATKQTYPVSWDELRVHIASATTYPEFKQMLGDCINQIIMQERFKLGVSIPSEGSIYYVQTNESRGPTLEEMETPLKSRDDPSMIVSPGYNGVPSIITSTSATVHAAEEPIPMSYAPYECMGTQPLPASIPSTSKLTPLPPTEPMMTMPPIGPTYTFTSSPPITLGLGSRPPMYAPYIPRPTVRPEFMPPMSTPMYRTPPGFPPRAPIPRYAPPSSGAGFPYYPPPPAATPGTDPIAVAAAVG